MKKYSIVLGMMMTGGILSAAQDDFQLNPRTRLQKVESADGPKTRVGTAARIGFNTSVNIRSSRPAPAGPAAGSRTTRRYDDGFVGVDRSGNTGGRTWFWGYENNAQYDPSGEGSIDMHHHHARGGGQGGDADIQPGAEFFISRDLKSLGKGWVGVEGALAYSHISYDDSFSGSRNFLVTTDSFSLRGSFPPGAPYAGTFEGPGTLIDSSPFSRSTSIENGTLDIDQELDAHMVGFRFGPYYEIPFNRFALRLDAGVAMAFVTSEFKYSETASSASIGTVRRHATNTTSDILVGPHVGLNLSYDVTDRLRVYSGLQYQNLGTFDQEEEGVQAEIDLKNSLYVTGGIGWKF